MGTDGGWGVKTGADAVFEDGDGDGLRELL